MPNEPIATTVAEEDNDEVLNVRPHGLTWPLETAQMVAWFNILMLGIIWWALHAPMLPFPASVVLSAIFASMTIAVVVLKMAATLCQSADDGVAGDLVYTPESFLNIVVPEGKVLCMYCKTIVSEDCKHCRSCDKCVIGFDHHCMWLGACVGSKTYRIFFVFTVCTLLLILFQAAVGWYLFAASVMDREEFEMRLRRVHNHTNVYVYRVFVFLFALYETGGACALGNLVGFHIYLKISEQSTYGWILKRRQEKREAEGRGEDTRSNKRKMIHFVTCTKHNVPTVPVVDISNVHI